MRSSVAQAERPARFCSFTRAPAQADDKRFEQSLRENQTWLIWARARCGWKCGTCQVEPPPSSGRETCLRRRSVRPRRRPGRTNRALIGGNGMEPSTELPVWHQDRWFQAKLLCPARITSVVERQQLGARFAGREVQRIG